MRDLFSKLRKPNLTKRLRDKIRSFFYFEQWILLLGKDIQGTNPSWGAFTPIFPPSDRIWADPFIWTRDGVHYVFFEEQPRDTKRGRICCMTVDNDLQIIDNQLALERPYHLSYPFLLEYNGELYMLPETGENRTIEIYRCAEFPYRWEKVKNLMSGVRAFDSTLLEANGKWWLFTNIAAEGGSTWDTLYLFYADHPLSESWTPHPDNPIIQDVRSARPAGKIFFDGQGFVRPSQDCSIRYGYATNFNRIEKLSETKYCESQLGKFLPIPKRVLGTHTWNRTGNLLAIDAFCHQKKFFNNKTIF